MPSPEVNPTLPSVNVRLELDRSFARLLDPADPLAVSLSGQLEQALSERLAILGVPAVPVIQIAALSASRADDESFLRILVNDQICPFSAELVQRVYSCVNGLPLSPRPNAHEVGQWLSRLDGHKNGDGLSDEAGARRVELLCCLCLETVWLRPRVFLTPEAVTAYLASLHAVNVLDLASMAQRINPLWLRPILQEVLDLKISIADRPTVSKVLAENCRRSRVELTEDLVVALRPPQLEIRLPEAYLRELTTASTEKDVFTLLRDGLFYELGVRLPDFRLVVDEGLHPRTFVLKINHLTVLPWVGIKPEQWLVNAVIEEDGDRAVKLNDGTRLPAAAALNPAQWNVCALVDGNGKNQAEASGLTTWSQLGYLILSVATDLRNNSALLLDSKHVQQMTEQLAQVFPALVAAVRQKVSLEQLTAMLRALLADQISIRNLRAICEAVLDYDVLVINALKLIVFDDRLPVLREPDKATLGSPENLATAVRASLKRYLSHKVSRGLSTLSVILLNPEVEEILILSRSTASGSDAAGLSPRDQERLTAALRAELRHASHCALLTTIEARPALRELVYLEFPRVPVLAYQELSPEMSLQPIARVSLDA